MKTIKLFAGLGNQLFQYSYGLSLRAAGEKVRYLLAPSPGCITDVFDLGDPSIVETESVFRSALIKAWARYVEASYEVGFYQEEAIARHALGSGSLRFRRGDRYEGSSWSSAVAVKDSTSIHIRGGDYRSGGAASIYGNVCGPEYYSKALSLLRSRVPNPHIFLFSDDPQYAEGILEQIGIRYSRVWDEEFTCDPGFDLYLMSRCQHHIIANSTFSWWGAALDRKSGGMVYCPRQWTSENDVDMARIAPSAWTKVDIA